MSNSDRRYWFSAKHKGGGRILHLISARSLERARASMERLSDEYTITQLTWTDLIALTGFAPPTVKQDTEFAGDSLLTEWRGKVVSIEVAD